MSGQILTVEDERAIADTLLYVLRTESFEPVWCELGTQALDMIRSDELVLRQGEFAKGHDGLLSWNVEKE